MNIYRKVVAVEVEGRKMGLVLDFECAIAYEEATGESLFCMNLVDTVLED